MRLRYYMRSCLVAIFATMAQMGFFSSCQDEDFGFTVQEIDHAAFLASGTFDFTTTGSVKLSVDYNYTAANCPIQVYDEYPNTDDGKLKEGIEPVFAFFLKNGKFEGTMNLPKSATSVWLASGGFGIPTLVKVDVYKGVANFSTNLTRADRNDYTIEYATSGSKTETIAEFVPSIWGEDKLSSGTKEVNGVTYHGTSDGWGGSAKTFADGKAWSNSIKFGGASTFESGKDLNRVISFEVLPKFRNSGV